MKPRELKVVAIEECISCKQKRKRDFRAGDYVTKSSDKCEKCGGQTLIILIYGETPLKKSSQYPKRENGVGTTQKGASPGVEKH